MKTGIIGLGAMGYSMALNLHKAGYLHRAWNRTANKADAIHQQTGVEIASSISSLAGECELIIISVSKDNDVIEVIEHIMATVRPGTIVVDTSTVNSVTAQQAATMLDQQQAHFLDCPVSGGVEGAKNGTLAMMVGGDEAILNKCKNVLSAIAKNIAYIGDTGSGQACKAVNQIMCAGINQAVTEALAFGEDMGLDMNKVIDIVSTGAAGNWFLDHRGKTMLAGFYDVGFKINLHHKDLVICQEMVEQFYANGLPLVDMTIEDYEQLMQQGYGDEDISGLYRLKRPSAKH